MKIVIVDDDCLVTGALKTILEVNEDVDVVATGLDGRDAVRLYGEYKPDVLSDGYSHEEYEWTGGSNGNLICVS